MGSCQSEFQWEVDRPIVVGNAELAAYGCVNSLKIAQGDRSYVDVTLDGPGRARGSVEAPSVCRPKHIFSLITQALPSRAALQQRWQQQRWSE